MSFLAKIEGRCEDVFYLYKVDNSYAERGVNLSRIKLYDKSSLHELPWEKVRDGSRIRSFLCSLVQEDPKTLISNVETRMQILTIDDLALPLSINCEEYDNSYVCSPYTHYITAAIEELKVINNRFIRTALKGFLKSIGAILKWGAVNRVVCVNNWLIPTNLHYDLNDGQLEEITKFLTREFPHHAIQFRSLNHLTNSPLINHLNSLGYQMIINRQIYLIDGRQMDAFSGNMMKKDFSLVKKSAYETRPIQESDIENILAHYNSVYLEKYSLLNPNYTKNWTKLISTSDCWKIRALEKEKNIDGAFAYLQIENVMTMPFFGYNVSLSQDCGLYRIISAMVAHDAKETKSILNMSAGASSFKRLRRGIDHLEFRAVYIDHLSYRQKTPWKLLKYALNKPAEIFLNKYGENI